MADDLAAPSRFVRPFERALRVDGGARSAPASRTPSDPTNGSRQLPVRSTMMPTASGERMPARAAPVFIRPLAVPE